MIESETGNNVKYILRFFFEYGAGGCLWSHNEAAYNDFGYGPIDQRILDETGKLSPPTLQLIEALDNRSADYLNKDYPPDPSLWRQADCDVFNAQVDGLIENLVLELGEEFQIKDEQTRYVEDPDLDEYLKEPQKFKRKKI
jgi:hypothetical protein